jgi:hypothetical protein
MKRMSGSLKHGDKACRGEKRVSAVGDPNLQRMGEKCNE